MLHFTIITLFPSMFTSPLSQTILKRAQEKNLVKVDLVDLRGYAKDRHRVTDDYPYGGGQGMVMKPEPLIAAIDDLRKKLRGPKMILLTPRGKVLDHSTAKNMATEKELVLICGRYEGVDERVKDFIDEELSVGDFTLSGGEIGAMVVMDAVSRWVPGVLGNERSPEEESFTSRLLEYPQYTRPEEFRGRRVPEVLLSGDHAKIREWRREMSLKLTRERRPDLFSRADLAPEERMRFQALRAPFYLALLHHPVHDKNGRIVTTAITNMDVHDLARSARTYGVRNFYLVHPVRALQKLAAKIIHHWEEGYGSQYNETRKEALSRVRLKDTLDDVILEVELETGKKPRLVATSARGGAERTSFTKLRDMVRRESTPFLLLLGTGWGLAESVLARSDYILEPIQGGSDYNHLSVRSAGAIILDRLLGNL